ncbi:hypothetical protein BKA61DRAFT_93115 [Leptodontidium sp. MPI-SDFR-AT-0119]|nr:hypothetical protein BKA61DRAFT_93115 [Leptodontidium sp. MPI-SDFR-AT-0119]
MKTSLSTSDQYIDFLTPFCSFLLSSNKSIIASAIYKDQSSAPDAPSLAWQAFEVAMSKETRDGSVSSYCDHQLCLADPYLRPARNHADKHFVAGSWASIIAIPASRGYNIPLAGLDESTANIANISLSFAGVVGFAVCTGLLLRSAEQRRWRVPFVLLMVMVACLVAQFYVGRASVIVMDVLPWAINLGVLMGIVAEKCCG